MNKICTTIEQSKKLLELGIDVNTADMYLWYSGRRYYVESMDDDDFNEKTDTHAWSLNSLLNIIKNRKDCNKVELLSNYASKWVLTTTYYNSVWKEKEIVAEDSIDAAVEMVCWLKENEKI